ncbi:SDR family NAD(P)-dependent oxidoreductase [Kineosporia sp. J2-2]|uniref:SDR family NAD(P)-dependent oxidoreductase n=1 Tax=Kineosporia corallincola TaxID=2835133 RepID=A0ABS5TR66_9ACTN|nr:SDR family NAD(P)-dependent oxidoreductase [Kineosporia corallincola]MBT0773321.1 SDR family NAD(P)-dependent oxidoreductase [Kineosporia corallincola]
MTHEVRTAVVTGASSGIGAAIATRLAGDGYRVVLVARRRERIGELAAALGGIAVAADVTDPDVARRFAGRDWRCDVLVNCAGGALGAEPVGTGAVADWSAMYDVNVLGTVRMLQTFLDDLLERQGAVINISSTAALAGYEGGAGYCAAKSGVRALTQSLRLELAGKPVRVVEILPGMVHTDEFALNRFRGDAGRAQAVYQGVDRPLTADDVARCVSFACGLPSHVNIDEMIVRPVAQAAQHKVHRERLHWNEPLAVPGPRWV